MIYIKSRIIGTWILSQLNTLRTDDVFERMDHNIQICYFILGR